MYDYYESGEEKFLFQIYNKTFIFLTIFRNAYLQDCVFLYNKE